MQIDLAGMIRRAGKVQQPYVLGRVITPTRAQEQEALAIYMRVVRGWLAQWSDTILPAYNKTLAELPGMRDSVGDVQGAVDDSTAVMTGLRMTLDAEFEDWEVRVEAWHRKQFAQSFAPSGVRLDTLLGRGDVQSSLEAVLADNVSLIRSLDDQTRNGISGAVFRGLTNRTPAREVAREIRRVANISKSRAELIAADQLQKLTARLDQERQEQVGGEEFEWQHSRKRYPRPEHVERNGKVYRWDSTIGKTDPPGRAIRCGCRSRPIIKLEPDAKVPDQPTPAPLLAPEAPAPAPTGPGRGFTPVRRADVNAETIPVRSRLALQKELRAGFAQAARDERYAPTREFRDRTDKDFGNATFSAGFDDEAASMIAAIKPEIDDLAAQIGLPPIRGFKSLSGGKAVANQGDGVMAFNPSYFNAYADRVGGRSATGALEDIAANRAALAEEMRPLVEEMRAIREERNSLPMGDPRYAELTNREYALYKPLAALRKKDDALWKKSRVMEGAAGGGVKKRTEWKPGDDVKGRPYSVGSYFADGVDQARATMYHEFAHHVHQYLKKAGPRRQYGTPPLERDLVTYYRQALHARRDAQASKYSLTNEHEWFAENFALFTLGRKDLVDETARDLIQRIFDGEY